MKIPETEKIVVDSRVAVPDGGTVVLGGQEITIKDKSGKKQNLLVLIKPKIVDK